MNEKLFSKSIKKQLTKEYSEDLTKSLDSRENIYPPLKEYLDQDIDTLYSVNKFIINVTFPINFREALKDDYSVVKKLYEDGIDIHNECIAGTKFPDDHFEWFNIPALINFRQQADKVFSEIGKKIAHKKRRKSAFEAQLFLYKNVLSPLDEFTWCEGCKLDFLFEKSIDLLCQSYLSEFVKKGFAQSSNHFDENRGVNFSSFCNTNQEYKALHEQMQLYNLSDYILMENSIKNIVSIIPSTELYKPNVREQIIFDVFELIPLYLKSWDVSKNKIKINDEITIFIFLDYGFPSFIIGKTEDKPELLMTSILRFSWGVNNSFISEGKRDCCIPEMSELGDFVLDKLYETLISLYAIRKPEKALLKNEEPSVYPDYSESEQLTNFTEQYHQILSSKVEDNSETISESKSIVPSMSMSEFFKFMKTNFDCNVDEGKGSEMKIWRGGHNIYTLGRHKKDPQIHSFLIKKVLKRLGIERTQWLEAFDQF